MSDPNVTAGAPSEAPNLLHVQFKNPEYLSYLSSLEPSRSSSPLTTHNILSYFATSPFFDRRSNNEQIRMQNIANGLASSGGPAQEEQELKRFTGLEFVLVHARPPGCFVVQKRWRTSPTETTPLAAYYVVNEMIYQAPDLYSVLATRLQSTVYGLKASLTCQRRARPNFDPRRGHHGRFIVPDPPALDEKLDVPNAAAQEDEQEVEEQEDQEDQEHIELEDVNAQPAPSANEPQVKRARFD